MTAKNDITGDAIVSKSTSDAYRSNYDAIFRKDKKPQQDEVEVEVKEQNTDQQ